jgi:hypothetical protein
MHPLPNSGTGEKEDRDGNSELHMAPQRAGSRKLAIVGVVASGNLESW